MGEKVIKITTVIRLMAVLMIAGVVVQMCIPQKIHLDGEDVTIRHLFTAHIKLKDILGITERISSKSGKSFYFIDTEKGSYEVDDGSFLFEEGKQIITKAGFSRMSVDERNIRNVYTVPKVFIDFKNQIKTESINYDFRKVRRVRTADQIFSDLYSSPFITFISLSLIIPFGYCSLHPESFKDVFPTWVPKEKPMSLKHARALSVCMFLMAFSLLVYCNGMIYISF